MHKAFSTLLNNYCLLLLIASWATFSSCNTGAGDGDSLSSSGNEVPELLERSETLRNSAEWDRVRNAYVGAREAIRTDPMNVDAHLTVARTFILEARVTGEHGHYYPAALEVLTRALQLPNTTPDQQYQALTMLASVQLSQHEFADALQTSQRAIKLNPYAAVGYGAVADAYVELGDYEKAVSSSDKIVQVKPDLRSYSRISYLREIHGDVDGALEAMRLALDAGVPGTEETAWVRTTLADVLKQYGRREEARDQYMLALEERPGYPFATAALAEMAAENGDFAKAESLLQEAIAAIPEVGFYEQLVHLYRATDRPEKADETVEEVMVMLADDVEHGHNMNLEYANAHINLTGDYDKALDYTLREYEKRPKNIDVNRMLASIYYLKNDMAQAAQHLDAASITNSRNPELVLIQGLLALEQGESERGLAAIDESLSHQPHPPAALGEALRRVRG